MQSEKSPWTSMLLDPKNTIRQIVDTNPHEKVLFLTVLGGFGQILSNASARGLGEFVPFHLIIFMCLIFGPISGLVSLHLGGLIMHWISHKLGGIASRDEIKAAIAWAWVPIVILLPLWIVKIIFFRHELFLSNTPIIDSQPILSTLFGFFTFIDLIISIWSLLILYVTLSEVNKFSTWRGFGTVVLSGLIVSVPVLILLYLTGVPANLM